MNEDARNDDEGQSHGQSGPSRQPNSQTGGENTETNASQRGDERSGGDNRPTFGHWLKDTPGKTFKLLLDILLVFASFGYIYYASRQWEAMRVAIQQTDASLRLARSALDLNRRQTEASEVANEISRAVLSSNLENARNDQAPHLSISSAERVRNLTSGMMPSMTLDITNTGKTVAVKAFPQLSAEIRDGFPDKKTPMTRNLTPSLTETPSRSDIAPLEQVHILTKLSRNITAEERQAVLVGRQYFVVFGSIDYGDIFGRKHDLWICSFYDSTDGGVGVCPNLSNQKPLLR